MKAYWESLKELLGIIFAGIVALGILFILAVLLEQSGGHRITIDSIISLF